MAVFADKCPEAPKGVAVDLHNGDFYLCLSRSQAAQAIDALTSWLEETSNE
jgi:hypothetical protein